jgi:hypothetical protein
MPCIQAAVYWTLLFPLTDPVDGAGYTEFEHQLWPDRKSRKLPTYVPVGSCLVFDGKTSHRGTANMSNRERIFAYVAVSSEQDANVVPTLANLMEPELRYLGSVEFDGMTITVNTFWLFHSNSASKFWIGRVEVSGYRDTMYQCLTFIENLP